jgi:hypothetical protein
MSLETLIKALFTKDASNCLGLRTVIVDVTACNELSDGVDCDNPAETAEQLFRKSIVLDNCGKPAIKLFNTANAT